MRIGTYNVDDDKIVYPVCPEKDVLGDSGDVYTYVGSNTYIDTDGNELWWLNVLPGLGESAPSFRAGRKSRNEYAVRVIRSRARTWHVGDAVITIGDVEDLMENHPGALLTWVEQELEAPVQVMGDAVIQYYHHGGSIWFARKQLVNFLGGMTDLKVIYLPEK